VKIQTKVYVATSGKKYQEKMVFLIPQESTHRTMFLDAWLPSPGVDPTEVVGLIPNPVHAYCKMAVRRSDEDVKEHHLAMLSIVAESGLIDYFESRKRGTVEMDILPADEWEKAYRSV